MSRAGLGATWPARRDLSVGRAGSVPRRGAGSQLGGRAGRVPRHEQRSEGLVHSLSTLTSADLRLWRLRMTPAILFSFLQG